MGGKRRSDFVEITNEHRAFKQMLEERKNRDSKFSYRQAGKLIGKSDSYISQLANGRAYFPQGNELDTLLSTLFGIKTKSFKERARLYKDKMTPQLELIELAEKLNPEKIQLVLKLAQTL